MLNLRVVPIDDQFVSKLKAWLQNQEFVFTVGDHESSLLICYSMYRELGGVNDELRRFIHAGEAPVRVEDLCGEIVDADGKYCFRISSKAGLSLSIVESTLNYLFFNFDGSLLISPSEIAKFITSCDLAAVAVRDWLARSIFSDFDPKEMSYRDQLWVLRNNEVMLYAELVADEKIIFQDMHDITAHIAGLKREGYFFAAQVARKVQKKLDSYFGPRGRGNMPSHLIPFLMGIILDGLTQSMIYGSEPRRFAIEELLRSRDKIKFQPNEKLRLIGFPKGIDRINGLLQSRANFSESKLKLEIDLLIKECVSLADVVNQRSHAI
jgi:hypothetical protein